MCSVNCATVCFSPVGQQLYLCVLVSLQLAVSLSVASQALLHTLLCPGLLVFQLLLQLMNPDDEDDERIRQNDLFFFVTKHKNRAYFEND